MFAIVQWNSYQDVSVVANDDGSPRLFLFRRDAERYAREEIAWSWQIIYLLTDR
jgi:hypothetical protein